MSKQPRPKTLRRNALIAILLAVGGGWIANRAVLHAGEQELQAIAEVHIQEWNEPGFEATSVVTVTRSYLLFGQHEGKIEVFLQPHQNTQRERISGIEFYYEKSNDSWELIESGHCQGELCQLRGHAAFARD